MAQRPAAGIVALVALLGALSFGWVRFDAGPPARAATERPPSVGDRAARAGGLDLDAVVERVEHAVRPLEGRPGVLGVADDTYEATFEPAGFEVSRPDADSNGLAVGLRHADRGGTGLTVRPRAWGAHGNAVRRAVAPGLTEVVTAREGEVEWDVVLATEPAGHGDLRLAAALTGLAAAEQRDGAWHLTLDDGTALRLGDVVVRDADGRDVHRSRPHVDLAHERVTLTVPDAVLDDGAYPLTVDPVVSPEHRVSRVIGAPEAQLAPAIAFDGTNHLVVWNDDHIANQELTCRVWGARIGPGGETLDQAGIPVASAVGECNQTPAVAFGGGAYVVVWNDGNGVVMARPFGTNGVPVASESPLGPGSGAPAIASNGTNFLVVWQNGTDIAGVLVPPSLTSSTTVSVSTASGTQSAPTVASNGSGFLVAWADTRLGAGQDIFFTRVSSTGTVLNTSGVQLAAATGNQDIPAVAFGANYLVTWQDNRTGSFDIRGARVSGTGTILDTTPLSISTATNNQSLPAVAFDGTRFLVAWRDRRLGGTLDTFATRVGTDGSIVDASGFALSTAAGDQSAPAVGPGPGRFLVGWEDGRNGIVDLFGTGVNGASGALAHPAGIVLGPGPWFCFPFQTESCLEPAVGFDGTNFLVVWLRHQAQSDEVVGARVAPDGTVLDPSGFVIGGVAPNDTHNFGPALAFDGTNYLVVWSRLGEVTHDVVGRRVSPSGTLVGSQLAFGFANNGRPAIAFDGTNYFVVWNNSDENAIKGKFVSPGGAINPSTVVVAPDPGFGATPSPPSVAFGGGTYLVVWRDNETGPGVRAARVSPAGAVADSGGDLIDPDGSEPAVGWTGSNFLIAWTEFREATLSDILAKRFSTGGAVLDANPIVVTDDAGTQETPAAAANGPVLIAWRDLSTSPPTIVGARVRSDGTVDDPSGITMGTGFRAAVSRGPGDDWGAVSDRFVTPVNSWLVHLRTVSPK